VIADLLEEQSLSGKTNSPAKTIPVTKWVVVDLASHHDVMQFESPWGEPYARRYWSNTGQAKIPSSSHRRAWVTFQVESTLQETRDGNPQARLRANAGALPAHLMTQSSNTATTTALR